MNPPTDQPWPAPDRTPPAGSFNPGRSDDADAAEGDAPVEPGQLLLPTGMDGHSWAESEDDPEVELADWKLAMRRDFEAWLGEIEQLPAEDEMGAAEDDEPDLYSFYEQLAVAGTEARKANRRTAEAFSQWSETLARFESSLAPLRETTAQLAAGRAKEERMSQAHCVVLTELLDRMHRLAGAFRSPPPAMHSWLGRSTDAAWRQRWESQRQAFNILVSHLEGVLKQEGVTRIETIGHPFDPTVMMAVAAEPDGSRPAGTVIEELGAGYRREGELLRLAQVKVARAP